MVNIQNQERELKRIESNRENAMNTRKPRQFKIEIALGLVALLLVACPDDEEAPDSGGQDVGADVSPVDMGASDAAGDAIEGDAIEGDASGNDLGSTDVGADGSDTSAGYTDEELTAFGAEAAGLTAALSEMNQALIYAVANPEFFESIPLETAFSTNICGLPEGLGGVVHDCPSYSLACNEGMLDGLSLTWGATMCADVCLHAGQEVTGEVVVARSETGGYDVTFVDFQHGEVTLDGTINVDIARMMQDATFALTTPTAALRVTRTSPGGTKSYDVTIGELTVTYDSRDTAVRWLLELDLSVALVDEVRSFAARTLDGQGLAFDGTLEQCYGPSSGTLQVGVVVGPLEFGVEVVFGADGGDNTLCSKPAPSAYSNADEVGSEEVRAAIATAAAEAIASAVGNINVQDFLGGVGSLEQVGHTTLLRALRALAQIVDMGDVRAALEDGWTSLVCGDEIALDCESGTATTTVQCQTMVVSGVEIAFASCAQNGATYDGTVSFSREVGVAPNGTFAFNDFEVDDDLVVHGELTAEQTSAEPLEVLLTTGSGGLEVQSQPGTECWYDLAIDTLRVAISDTDIEVEFAGTQSSEAGVYGLTTLAHAETARHLVWPEAEGCVCPTAGSHVELLTPNPAGDRNPLTFEVTYTEPTEMEHCAGVTVELTSSPLNCDDIRGGNFELPRQGNPCDTSALTGELETFLETLCVPL